MSFINCFDFNLSFSLQKFAAKIAPLWNEASSVKLFHSPRTPFAKLRFRCEKGHPLWNYFAAQAPPPAKIFAAAKHPLGTWVPFRSPSPHFALAKPSTKPSKAPKASFRNQSPILQLQNPLRNTPLAHECHFAAPPSHFAAAKWAAKMPLSCENCPWLWNEPPPTKNSNRHLDFNLTL